VRTGFPQLLHAPRPIFDAIAMIGKPTPMVNAQDKYH
jgi:hypothetical protein